MSQSDNENFDDLPMQDERAALEQRATTLGINFHPNISLEKLRERVNAALNPGKTEAGEEAPKPGKETDAQRRSRKRQEASKLIRCRIHCNDPAKKEWPGEYITVGNAIVGSFRKYIPYNIDEPYHVPQIILNTLREKRVQVFTTKKSKSGNPVRESKSIAAYTIEIVEPLTEEELKKLGESQTARNALSDNV